MRLVSILIPAYNSAAWIAETLESAIGQTWARTEVIVVDDGSSDDTLAVARRYESSSVRVTSQPNRGASSARNTALSLSHGDYIQWLDADDILASDKIARQMQAAEGLGTRSVLSSAWAPFRYRRHRAVFRPTALWADLTPVEWLVHKMGSNLHMQTATWLVSREVTMAAGPWNVDLSFDDDGEYFCRVLLQSEGVKFVPESKVYYRESGVTRLSYVAGSDHKLESLLRSMELHLGYLRSLEDGDRVRAAGVRYLQTWLNEIYPDRPDIVRRCEELAGELGGGLQPPAFGWKFAWIAWLGGPRRAKRVQVLVRRVRNAIAHHWDKLLSRLEPR